MSKIIKTMDGNEAAAYAAYAFTEVAGIYPITPSSPMADFTDLWAAQGKKNLFGMPVKVVEMQSEGGAAGTVHGSLQAGALTTTYTASQGLLLKIPNMYKIAGQLLPGVIHVSSRTLATHALSIFGDHQDIYACRQTGFAMLSSGSVQEVMDLAGIAHLSAIKGRVPFLHFFDGFRTSHELQKIELIDYKVFDKLLDKNALKKFREDALSPDSPKTRGTAQNDDIYFQARESQNKFFEALPDIVNEYMQEISKETKREYKPFVYYGHKEAENIVIAMGSVTESLKEVIDHLIKEGKKVGLIIPYLYRPFSVKYLMEVVPKSVKKIAVLDRTKEPGSIGEPLFLDIKAAFYETKNPPIIVGGRYGLSSKNVDPSQLFAVFENLEQSNPKKDFTIGIVDDVTFKSLNPINIQLEDQGTKECLFYGLGADGTVGANKSSIKIIGDNTNMYTQAYFAYDSKKSGGFTKSYLRFGFQPIRSTYFISNPHFVACSVEAYLDIYKIIDNIRENGIFLLNSLWNKEEIVNKLPNRVKKILANKKVRFYIINATKLAREIGLKNRTNTIMQSAFFKLTEIIPYDKAKEYMKEQIKETYKNKGQNIIDMNFKAVDLGESKLIKISINPDWANLLDEDLGSNNPYKGTDFVEKISKPMNAALGNDLPVSVFTGYEDGSFEHGTTEFEKRGIGVNVPKWIEEYCIQCNQCVFVCPHAVIRAFLIDDNEIQDAPNGVKEHTLDAKGKEIEGLKYKIQISPLDCTGCELCVEACPTKDKSLIMEALEQSISSGEQINADYLFKKVKYKDDLIDKISVKSIGYTQPLFEFHGACPGCGETPYITLATKLFGESMVIANATGCSSIYGASAPSTPYRKNSEGRGPAWANSLFEDNAEFGFGMNIASNTIRHRIENIMLETLNQVPNALSALYHDWIENKNDRVKSLEIRNLLVPQLYAHIEEALVQDLIELIPHLAKRSQWIIGGDGWAYDIGYGGLDHVIASGENINILVLDTEVYSNTGGQSSKASRTGSVAQFTASGKPVQKKDLGLLAMTYGNIYIAQVNLHASQTQTLKAFEEAESYNGPSIIIAYSPCIAHGIKGGMAQSGNQADLATKCGYWPLYKYNPELVKNGQNPIKITGKEPDWTLYEEFLLNEVRYASLKNTNPEHANILLEHNKQDAKRRYRQLKRLATADYSNELEE